MGTLVRAISVPFPHTWIICCLPGHPASADAPGAAAAQVKSSCTFTFLFLRGLSKRTKPQLSSWFSDKPSHHCSSPWHAALPTAFLLQVKSLWTSLEPGWSLAQRKRKSSCPGLPFLPAVGAEMHRYLSKVCPYLSKCSRRTRTIAHTLPPPFSSL